MSTLHCPALPGLDLVRIQRHHALFEREASGSVMLSLLSSAAHAVACANIQMLAILTSCALCCRPKPLQQPQPVLRQQPLRQLLLQLLPLPPTMASTMPTAATTPHILPRKPTHQVTQHTHTNSCVSVLTQSGDKQPSCSVEHVWARASWL